MKLLTKKGVSILAILSMVFTMFGFCIAQTNQIYAADVNLAKSTLSVKGGSSTYSYDGKAHGADKYTVYYYNPKTKKNVDITKKVNVSQNKHTDCGEWYVKVEAKKGSGYTGSKMVFAYTIEPKSIIKDSVKANYNKSKKTTTISFKMPILKKGHYEYIVYTGSKMEVPYDTLTAKEKKRVVMHGESKDKAWKSGEAKTVTVKKGLSANKYHVDIVAWDSVYTNKSGTTKSMNDHWADWSRKADFTVK